ncbi:heterodisulfide reductase-related iron-sulfur binding cluster [Verrucomicrobia bacterium]|jgi:Fe-S oxidoreductase/nitrate reductase gamma subunit|nr:heterodisulfide reductase-related iron-sulfur binding cluster [Verrucomicrobiota bacterium]
MNPTEATREVMWNISHGWIMYALLIPTLWIAGYGVYRRVQCWRQGRPVERLDRPWDRLQHLWNHALLQRRTLKNRFAGIFHAFIFWGVITLTAATTVVFIHHDFGIPIMQGKFYLYFQSLFVDVLGFLAIIGILMAAYRRFVLRPKKLVFTDEAMWILILGLVILVSGFLVEGWRIAATDDPWGAWSPFGFLVAEASSAVASDAVIQKAHWVLWWGHLLLAFGLIAWAPYTKMIHPLTSALNIYAANLGPVGGSLKTIDFDSEEPFGVNQIEAFTWKDLLDLDACTECGRCTDACPAHSVGKALSPRDLILELRDHMHQEGVTKGTEDDEGLSARLPALAPESLWQCTTCAACVEACPVSIEQLPKIVDLRRFQVMEEAAVPDSIQAAMTSLETRGHPFTGSRYSRLDWTEGLDVPVLSEAQPDPDVLLWVGCGGALVERNQKSTRSLATLLERAGVSYAILGREEKCTGDPARRMGNEFLFEQLAQENVDLMTKHKIKKVVTSCPHCFNTFRNEYPRMGAKFEVVHHTEFLGKLIESGKLKMKPGDLRKIALHDPCYLSRHNGITDAPRDLIRSASGTNLIEAERSGKESFCCGGGGGMSFVDEPAGQRVNQERSREMLETGANTVAVACPFCTTMMEDGVNAQKGDRQVEVKEISELVLEASEEV